jgi:hypothetical protein
MRIPTGGLLSIALVLSPTLPGAARAFAQTTSPTYYLVEGIMQTPDGRQIGVSVSLAKRTLQPDAGTIEERVLQLRGREPATEFDTTIKVDGAKGKVSGGGFEGDAQFTGAAWAWDGMQFSGKTADGNQIVEGKDEFRSNGMTADKRVLDASGKLLLVVHETGTVISAPVYEMLRSRLMPK